MAKTKQLLIREIPLADWDALERIRLRLRLPRESFARLLLHVALWGAAPLFERTISDALGMEEPLDESLLEEAEAEAS